MSAIVKKNKGICALCWWRIGLHKCMHLSKFNKCPLKICALHCAWLLPPNKYEFQTNKDIYVEIFRDKCWTRPGISKLVCKGPDGKYFRPYRPYFCYLNYLTQFLQQRSHHRQFLNKWKWLCLDKTLFTKTGSGPDLILIIHYLPISDLVSPL